MKKLTRLLLINWHYFWKELIEFDTINFLTGANAAGKSTIIDAIQLLLLGDTSGHFFNKAANDKSARTLKGYLWGEIGDDGDAGFRYLRSGRFTSYIACEFYDDFKDNWFTLGVVFDCYDDGTFEHRFFILDDSLPENHFIQNNTPMSFKELRSYFMKNYKRGKFQFPETNRGYQDILRGKLGGLKLKYFSLFKKAVPFSPIADIESFITNDVCDIKGPVDISLMQDNIRYYKRLEQDAEMMMKRIAALEDIQQKYNAYMEEKQRFAIHSYIIERAQLQMALDEVARLEKAYSDNQQKINEMEAKINSIRENIKALEKEHEQLIADKISSDIYRKMDALQSQKARLEEQLQQLKGDLTRTIKRMRHYGRVWRECIHALQSSQTPQCRDATRTAQLSKAEPTAVRQGTPWDEPRVLNWQDIEADWNKLMEFSEQALTYAEQLLKADSEILDAMAVQGFDDIITLINNLKQTAARIGNLIDSAIIKAKRLLSELADEVENLKRGIKPYARNLLELKNEISSALSAKYGREVQVHILADLLEIRDMRWRNAIEAYLHTQKFYLIVEPEYFVDALKVYDKLKFERGFYDLGLVDTGRLAELKPAAMENSLAQEVETSNPYARMFVDFVMGNVIKCDKVEDLRNYPRAITDSCMLYQNFVARQLHPDRWRNPYIGRRAIEEQIESKTAQIAQIEKEVTSLESMSQGLRSIYSMESMNLNEAENILEVLEKSKVIPSLEAKLKDIVDELGKLDLSWLAQLDKKIKAMEKEIENLKNEEQACLTELIGLKTKNNEIAENKLPAEKQKVEFYRNKINSEFPGNWIQEKGEPRFEKELSSRASAVEIYNNFYSQLARTQSQMTKKKEELVAARSEYNREYRMSYDINLPDNGPYEKELNELKAIKLPEYMEKIKDAKEKAYQQFRDDFLAKLKANIDMVKEQIEELNTALKESSFGNDRYRFVVSPRPEYRRFYDMITDELLMDGYNLASQVFLEKHRDAIEELFKQITNVDSQLDADARAELEKNIKRFTDYKTYLTFDLIVTDSQDRQQRLSKTLHKKSGGETQTPFYIAMLASFAQLYRTRYNNESGNTIRLIMFDEAFSKMDSDRIQESIKLLRKFGLQAILSAPSEKIGDIAPLVDRTLCVIRSGNRSFVKAFDAKRIREEMYELQEADTQPAAGQV
ncbi:ATP-binding protein [Caldicoprobacter faecalis]|uniref:Uncharacterized protein YPO0396 n=1 Tax=Caldicoprobacter faecalis TaxID=937334 RepID=A0A1I5XFI0_9FIRM|nr:SbcC/MukB-like Walker B domain-containing protein [Caldicoprobacter faecalis]SFQ30725.1 Uncharacterized protein YPO0396 [Caldicoprobacter faecalis]